LFPPRKAAEGDGTAPESDVPADTADFEGAAAGAGFANDDDLPCRPTELRCSWGTTSTPPRRWCLPGLPWSFSALSQPEARAHRLTSTRPVSVYAVLTRGSLDERKWELLRKKGAASDLRPRRTARRRTGEGDRLKQGAGRDARRRRPCQGRRARRTGSAGAVAVRRGPVRAARPGPPRSCGSRPSVPNRRLRGRPRGRRAASSPSILPPERERDRPTARRGARPKREQRRPRTVVPAVCWRSRQRGLGEVSTPSLSARLALVARTSHCAAELG
jgi:hypothetical protein